MPNRLMLEVGPVTVSVPIKGTASKINSAIRRYAVRKGLEIEGKNAEEIGTLVLADVLRVLRETSVDQHRQELNSAQAAAIEATITGENDL